jgi:hypothetical protein
VPAGDARLGGVLTTEKPDEMKALVFYRIQRGMLRITVPGAPSSWLMPSFGEFVLRPSTNDPDRAIVQEELVNQLQGAVDESIEVSRHAMLTKPRRRV